MLPDCTICHVLRICWSYRLWTVKCTSEELEAQVAVNGRSAKHGTASAHCRLDQLQPLSMVLADGTATWVCSLGPADRERCRGVAASDASTVEVMLGLNCSFNHSIAYVKVKTGHTQAAHWRL